MDEPEDSESNTLGGWVLEKFEEIPEKGESFTYKNLTVSVNETDSRRVLSVRIKVEENAEHNDNGE